MRLRVLSENPRFQLDLINSHRARDNTLLNGEPDVVINAAAASPQNRLVTLLIGMAVANFVGECSVSA